MAVDDVYSCKIIGEGREGEWTMNLHYREITPPSESYPTEALATSLTLLFTPVIRAALSASHQVSRFEVHKVSGVKQVASKFSLSITNRVGMRGASAVPANSPVILNLVQEKFPSKHNGVVWMSGVPVDGVLGSNLTALYADTEIKAITDLLVLDVDEQPSGDGIWRLIVLSRKWLVLNPGDYVGASADVVEAAHDVTLGMQRGRGFGGRRRIKPEPVEEP